MAMEIKVGLRQVSPSTSEATMRTHRIAIDRPVEKGGIDAGPMGGELFLAAISGCFMSNLLAAARARGLTAANIRTDVTGKLADAPPRFTAVEVVVSADSVDVQELEHLAEIADRGCIMMNTLRGKLDIAVRIAAAQSAAQRGVK